MATNLEKLEQSNDFQKTDLIFGPDSGGFQERKFDVSRRQTQSGIELQIHDGGKNTIIEIQYNDFSRLTNEVQQRILNNFYNKHKNLDSFFSQKNYVHTPTQIELYGEPIVNTIIPQTIEEKKPILTETRVKSIQEKITELKTTHPDLYALLEANGTIKNSLENTNQLEKFIKYIDYLNYLYEVTRVSDEDPSETSQEISQEGKFNIVKKYKELRSEKTDYILNKEFLEYKYLEAIIRDVNRMGYNIESGENGGYVVRHIETKEIVDNSNIGIYAEVLEKSNLSNDSMQIAIMSNIIVTNPKFKDIYTQIDFINKLFSDYGILAGREDEDKTKYIIVDKERILKEISAKKELASSIQEYQELAYLKSFILNYKNNQDLDNFRKANTYAKGFLEEKAFIDAYKRGEILKNGESTKTVPDQIADFINNNRLSSGLLGLIAWVMGYKKTALGALGLGLFGGTIAEMVSGIGNKAGDVVNGGEKIIDPIKLNQIAPYIDEQDYQDKFDELVQYNARLGKQALTKVSGKDVYRNEGSQSLDPKKLNSMISFISNDYINLDLRDPDLEAKLLDILGSDFYTEDEVKILIKLLRKVKETGDNTILDCLTKDGKDILNKFYESREFTGEKAIDEQINSILQEKWDRDNITREEKKSLVGIKDIISGEFSNTKKGLEAIKKFFSKDWWKGEANMPEFDVLINSDNVVNKVGVENKEISEKLRPIFESYKYYIELDVELQKYEGWIDENWDTAELKWQKLVGMINSKSEIANNAEIYVHIVGKIDSLNNLEYKIPVDKKNKEPFKTLLERLSKVRNRLKIIKKDLELELDGNGNKLTSEKVVDNFNFDIPEVLASVQTNKTKLDSFLKEQKFSISDLESDFDDIGNIYYEQSLYSDGLKKFDRTKITDKGEQHIFTLMEGILTTFETQKSDIEAKFKKPIEDYYTETQLQFDSLDKIDNSTSIDDDMKVLESVKNFGISKGVDFNISIPQFEIDLQIKEILRKSQEILGANNFMSGLTGTSLEQIFDKYNSKFASLDTKIKTKINNLGALEINEKGTQRPKTSIELKSDYKKLEELKKVFGNHKDNIEKKQQELMNQYISVTKLGDDLELQECIKEDLEVLRNTLSVEQSKPNKNEQKIKQLMNFVSFLSSKLKESELILNQLGADINESGVSNNEQKILIKKTFNYFENFGI